MTEILSREAATALLPDLPGTDRCDTGYDWIVLLTGTGWREVAGIGDQLLGDWPYQVVAFYDDPEMGVYGIAVYTEGDVWAEAFTDRWDRHKAALCYADRDDEDD
jgi:hypothetical protein